MGERPHGGQITHNQTGVLIVHSVRVHSGEGQRGGMLEG